MKYRDLSGNIYIEESGQDVLLERLYGSLPGRMLLRPLVSPALSKAAGLFLDSGLSRFLIRPFIRKNHIDLSVYVKRKYRSFNDFFTREIRPEQRMIDYREDHLVSPADGRVSAFHLDGKGRFCVKHSIYSLASLLRDKRLAARYLGGYALVIRLCVDDYHRYCYPASGEKSRNVFLPGIFHTVNPAACGRLPVYHENAREYTLIKTEPFGTILQMEVGAMLVGRICNYHGSCQVEKGEEKGRFEYGGSTVILLLEPGKARPDRVFLENTAAGYETLIHMGEKIVTAQTS